MKKKKKERKLYFRCLLQASSDVENMHDSIQNVGWQTGGTLTASNSSASDYILQIRLSKARFPREAAPSRHPEMKQQTMIRGTLNNSGFQEAPALLNFDIHNVSFRRQHAYTLVLYTDKICERKDKSTCVLPCVL